jgi:hypothetical protein
MNYREKIEASRMAKASAAEAVAWLEDNALAEKPSWTKDLRARQVIEYLLFRRKDPSINLALARFATYAPVLRKLYQTADKATQLTINPATFPRSCRR